MCAVITMKRQFDSANAGTVQLMRPALALEVKVSTQAPKTRKRRRMVSFSEENNQTVGFVPHEDTWLSKADYRALRKEVMQNIHEVCTSPLRPTTLLNGTAFSEKPEKNQANTLKRLAQWSRYIDSGRGLENQVHSSFGKARREQRSKVVRSVLVGQELARLDCNVNKDELLQLISQEFSETAKSHALLVGLADEKALSHDLLLGECKKSMLQAIGDNCS